MTPDPDQQRAEALVRNYGYRTYEVVPAPPGLREACEAVQIKAIADALRQARAEEQEQLKARVDELEAALNHVWEYIPTDRHCQDCQAAKALAWDCGKRIVKALEARAEGRQEHPSIDDLAWLKDYAMGAAFYSDQNTCVGRAEHAAAARDSDRAESIFDKLIAIAEGRQEQDK